MMVSVRHVMVKDTNNTTDDKDIVPTGKHEVNAFTGENGANPLYMFGKNHNRMDVAIVMTPAMIWFSVMLDAKVPSAMYAIPNSKKPNRVVSAVDRCGSPNCISMAKYMNVNSSDMSMMLVPAMNFASTMEVMLLGAVSNSCSVPVFLSSANRRMVSMGTIKVSTVAEE